MKTAGQKPARRPNEHDEARLLRALCAEGNPGEMKRLLSDLLTPAEYGALKRRWAIFELLEEGATQREVAEAIGGSLCSVTRGARIRREGGSAALAARERLGRGGKAAPR